MRPWVILLFCSVLATGRVAAQPSVTSDAIRDVWERRQARVQSVRIEWNERRTWTKGCITKWMTPAHKERAAASGKPGLYDDPAPSEDTTLEYQVAVLIKGDKMRYEHDGYQWSFDEKRFFFKPLVSTFDGKVGKHFYRLDKSESGAPMPSGSIRNESRHFHVNNILIRPVVTAFRGTNPWFANYDPVQMRATGRTAVIDGRSCVEVEIPSQPKFNPLLYRLWFDTDREFVLVRHLSFAGNRPNHKIDIRYRPDAVAGWAPSNWTIVTHVPDGTIESSYECTVTSIEFNRDLSDKEFDIEFPRGTWVNDLPNNTEYVIKKSGEKREIIIGELGNPNASYERLMETDAGQLLPGWKPWYRRFSTYLYAVATLAAVILLFRLARWRLSRRTA